MSDPVLSQLVSVESDLTEQVEQLETQLTQLQAQRQELQTVIDMFQADGSTSAEKTTAAKPKATSARTKQTPKSTPRKTAAKSAAKSTAKKTGKATKTSTAKSKPGPKPKATTSGKKKKDGRAANWQKHVKPKFKDDALPEAVSSVLRSQPSEVFKIVDVMSTIFKEDVPRPSYLKARNRISNILSAGARDGTWYRGSNGRYSLSESVTKL